MSMLGYSKKLFSPITQFWVKYKADTKYISLILLVSIVFFWKILLYPGQLINNGSVIGSDIVNFFYPLYNHAYDVLSNGVFPYWNSLILSGYPLAANPQFSPFYLFNPLFTFLPAATAFGFSYLLHIFLGGTFMYCLSKHLGLSRVSSFLSAIIFIFGAFISSHIYAGHYTLVCAAIWFPLLFLLFDVALTKKSLIWGMAAGVILGIQLMTGHIQVTYISLIALGVYLIYKLFFIIKEKDYQNILKPIVIMVVLLLVGVLLSAVKLFPMYEYSIYSTRTEGLNYHDATSYSLTPKLLSLLFLNPWAGPSWATTEMQNFGFWEYSSYIGVLTLFLVVIGISFSGRNKNIIFFSLLLAVSIVLALGEYTAFYWILYKLIPGFDAFRAPARFIMLFGFAVAVLAGYGFDYLREKLTREQVSKILIILVTILATLIALITIMAIFPIAKYQAVLISLIILAILIISSVCIIYLRVKNRLSGKYFNVTVISFIILDLWFFHMPFIDVKPVTDIYQTPSYVSYLQEHSQGYRVYDPENIITLNHSMTYGISEINGYDATALNPYSEFMGNNVGVIGSSYEKEPTASAIANLGENKLSLLNVKYVLSSKPLENSNFTLAYSDSGVYIYEYMNALPQAFIVHNAEVISSGNDALARIKDTTFDVRKEIILLENPTNISLLNASGVDEVLLTEQSAQEILINVSNTTPGFLVLSTSWYPCWKVYVDGKPSELYKTDYVLMSVFLDSGNHNVNFVYEDQTFRIGILVSCVTGLTLAVVFITYGLKIRKTRILK
jgi:uncharacterized membrane protein YfhO